MVFLHEHQSYSGKNMDTLGEEELIVLLREKGFCLVTNEDGSEQVDDDGKLYVCQDGSDEWFPVPNSPSIRKLYDLPLLENYEESVVPTIDQEVNSDINEENMQVDDEGLPQNDGRGEEIDKSKIVWMGQRSRACLAASRALIEIIDTPKYQELMNDKGLVKLKVWEKIATDIQARGFRVATNEKDAGLRTFQKWRNMERAYWTYIKNPEGRGDDMRKKKPPLFEYMDPVMKKMSKFASKWIIPMSTTSTDTTAGNSARETENTYVKALLEILLSDKYPEFYKSGGKSITVWNKISRDLRVQGFPVFGKSRKVHSLMMYQKWRTMEKKFHKYQLQKDHGKGRPLCYDLLSKVIYKCLISKQTPCRYEKKQEEFSDSDDENSNLDITDHDYGSQKRSQKSGLTEESHTFSSEAIVSALNTTNEALAMSTDTLLQIKVHHEYLLRVQRDNHSQIKSLLEAQLEQQKTLNSLFNEYVVNRSKKVKSGSSKNDFVNIS